MSFAYFAGNESSASTGDASSTTGDAVQTTDAAAAAAAAAHNYDGTPLVCFPSKSNCHLVATCPTTNFGI